MKDAYEVLRQKEADLVRIRHEVSSLKIVAPLLTDDSEESQNDEEAKDNDGGSLPSASAATGTDGLFSYSGPSRPGIWKQVLKRGK